MFFSTFRDISYFIIVLCEKGDHEAIKSGLATVGTFFASIKSELNNGTTIPIDEITGPSYLSYVEELLSAFNYACDSKGDVNSQSAQKALEVATSIDENYGGDSISIIKKFFR